MFHVYVTMVLGIICLNHYIFHLGPSLLCSDIAHLRSARVFSHSNGISVHAYIQAHISFDGATISTSTIGFDNVGICCSSTNTPHASSSALEGVVEGSAAGSITGANPQPRPTRAPELLIDPQPRPTSARRRPTRAPALIEDADSDTDSFDLEAELDRLSSWSAGSESDHEVPSASESDDAVTHVRHNPAWRIRCEEGYGADKPSQMLRVHLACAGIDAPGRAMTEYGVSQPSCTNYICSRYWRLTRRNTCKQFKKRSKCTPKKLIQSIINATEIKKL